MSAEDRAIPLISRELARIRKVAPDEAATRKKWHEANAHYIEHVLEGRGDKINGDAILGYYATRQAYVLYAQERGFSLEVS